MPYRISLFLSLLVAALFWAGCDKSNDDINDNNNNNDEPRLLVDLPIANVGDEVTFTVVNFTGQATGYRYDVGDGSGAVSASTSNYKHTYTAPGTYTVTATVFSNNESTVLTANVTVEGDSGSRYGPSIRIREIDLLTLESSNGDLDQYLSFETDAASDPYFKVTVIYGRGSSQSTELIYPRSTTKMNTQTTTWNYTNEIPLIYYEDMYKVEIAFMDDDAPEGNADDFVGNILIFDTSLEPYLATKPTQMQWTRQGTTINLTIDWID